MLFHIIAICPTDPDSQTVTFRNWEFLEDINPFISPLSSHLHELVHFWQWFGSCYVSVRVGVTAALAAVSLSWVLLLFVINGLIEWANDVDMQTLVPIYRHVSERHRDHDWQVLGDERSIRRSYSDAFWHQGSEDSHRFAKPNRQRT